MMRKRDFIAPAIGTAAAIADTADLGIIFGFKQLFEAGLSASIAPFILFPFSAAMAWVEVFLKWHEVYKDGGQQKRKILNALITTFFAFAISFAVFIALAAFPVSGLVVPVTFAGAVALKAIYHLIYAVDMLRRALQIKPITIDLNGRPLYREGDFKKRQDYLTQAKNNFTSGSLGLLGAGILTVVMVFGHVKIAAFLGLPFVGAAIGISALKFALFVKDSYMNNKQAKLHPRDDDTSINSFAITKRLRRSSSHDLATSKTSLRVSSDKSPLLTKEQMMNADSNPSSPRSTSPLRPRANSTGSLGYSNSTIWMRPPTPVDSKATPAPVITPAADTAEAKEPTYFPSCAI